MQRWLILGLFHLEALAREYDTGYVSRAVWKQIMQIEAASLGGENFNELLDEIWETKLSK